LEFSDTLNDEMERLNQSFGIGIIELSTNPYESRVLFQPHYRELDFKTIDKLCKINEEFEQFVEQIIDHPSAHNQHRYNVVIFLRRLTSRPFGQRYFILVIPAKHSNIMQSQK